MRSNRLCIALAALASFGWGAAAMAEAAPRKVVSFNLCADQLVLALAEPQQIAGLSPYAADPRLSVMADAAKAFPRVDWSAESILALRPDLVLAGPVDRGATRRMLMALGLRVEAVELVSGIDAAREQIIRVAALLGQPQRGRAMAARLDAARQRLARAPAMTALAVERGGYTAGSDSLIAALLAEAGLRPPAGAPRGFGGFVQLEQLVMLKPDLIVLNEPPAPVDQGSLYLTHPALRGLYPPQRRLIVPLRYTACAGPALIEALNYLADTLPRLGARP
jgi:iron complex transport system substrate-binding protein